MGLTLVAVGFLLPQGARAGTAASPIATDATFHSGGRKLIVDRNGNLIAFARSADNTLTAYYSNDGGKTWTNAGNLSIVINTEGFGVSYDGVTSTIHIAYITTAPALRYNQVNIGYDASGNISSLTFNEVVLTMGGSGGGDPTVTIIAASGTKDFVPIIFYERWTSGGTRESGLYFKQCKMSNTAGVADCRNASNWSAEATICQNTSDHNDNVGGVAATQSRQSKKVWVFINDPDDSSFCVPTNGDFLSYSLGVFSSTSTWIFPTSMTRLDGDTTVANRNASPPYSISTLNDTAWSSTNSRVLVVYNFDYFNGTWFQEYHKSFVLTDDNTATSSQTIDSNITGDPSDDVSRQTQCSLDTTPEATSSKRFLCATVHDESDSASGTIRLAYQTLDLSGWKFTTVLDPYPWNSYPMVKTSYSLAYDPYGLWRGWQSTTSYTAVKESLGTGPKFDVVYAKDNNLFAHTWHLQETLFVTSTILATAPSNTSTNPSAATFADENDYSAATSSNDIRLSVTTAGSSAFPIFSYRKANTGGDQTRQIAVHWEGQSTNTATDVRVQIFRFKEPNNGWHDLATGAPPSVNTDFTISATATADFPISGASMSDYYGIDPTKGISDAATSLAMVRVYQGAAANQTLRTDVLRVSFAEPPPPPPPPPGTATLTQRAYVFQNDSGNIPDTNSIRGTGIAYPVQKGERFAVRFQVDNTGDGATTTQLHVQYDHSDGIWKSVTSGEIALSPGISGANGDALTTTTSKCVAGTSFANGKWYENTATSLGFTLNASECTELAFVFSTATAVARTTYRFRLVSATYTVPFASVATPSIVMVTFPERKHSKTGLSAEAAAAPAVSDDLAYYLDDTGYAAVAANDGVYDTATSTGSNVPVSLFKLRNPYANNTESFTITWNGQTNVSSEVFLEIWNGSEWESVQSNASPTENADFTLSGTKSGSQYFDASFFVSVRVRQAAGAEGLRTDFISLTWRPSGPQVDRQDILSDSRPGVSANHTISFTINSGFDASEFIELDWPADFTFPADLDCGDVDVATGTQFMLSTTSTGCLATATNWGAVFISDTRVFRLTAPSDPPPEDTNVYIATGTLMTFRIGLNASHQQSGTTQIVNPSAEGTYTLDVAGPVGTGRMLVAIIGGVTVQATVAESLNVSITGIAAGSCTADDGASVTARETTATNVPFSTINANSFYIACQDVQVSTNATGGYSATVLEYWPMRTAGGLSIPDTTCDAGGCTESAGAAWTNAAVNGFGHTCRNQVNNDCVVAYSNGTQFRQFANISGGETAQEFMASSTPASATSRVKYRLSAGLAQGAGTYTTTIVYTVTPTF